MNLEVLAKSDYGALSRSGADLIAAAIRANPAASLVVATGRTPMGTYHELTQLKEQGEIECSRLRVFQLDEYLGPGSDDPRSLYGWMRRTFLEPLDIPPEHVVRLRGDSADPDQECREYDLAVQAAGGLDLAVLGLGPNGHLGFNEPPSDGDSPTRVVELTPESVESNARYWDGRERVPRRALTAGMRVLLAARRTVLLVSGVHKREILHRTLGGPVTPMVPASYLRRAACVTVIADSAAAGSPFHPEASW